MRLLSAALLVAAAVPALAAEPEVVGGDWLAIDGVDARGRAPFNPDALLRRYLLDADAPPPHEGDTVIGTKGEAQAWTKVSADEKGFVAGSIAMAYRAVESPGDRIVLADLPGGSSLVVNGTPYVGDVYGGRMGPVPVALRKGTNHVYVRGSRGRFKLTFEEPEGSLVLTGRDTTAPDYVVGRGVQGDLAAVVVANCTTRWATGVVGRSEGSREWSPVLRIAPLGVLKVPVGISGDVQAEEGAESISLPVAIEARFEGADAVTRIEGTVELAVRRPDQAYVRTFLSAIDSSVQEYGVRDSVDGDRTQLVLSVHGAGVGCRGQAGAYSARPGVVVVAATNRRPFGFDWQDWGRTDAYEVLEDALAWTGADRSRVCLTGHSMGGHGTWHLAANDPDGWAAIAPSAGWSQFDHYGGRPAQARRQPWYGADAASDTLSLVGNLVQIPTFVLHGTADDNVPLSEAQRMLAALRDYGGVPQAHFQEGAGHWWDGDVAPGADCVDWPPIFDLFAQSRIPQEPDRVDWTTVDPGVDWSHHWVRVEQPLRYGERIHVRGWRNELGGSVGLQTRNARLLAVTGPPERGLRRLVIDGQTFTFPDGTALQWLERVDGAWRVGRPVTDGKDALRSGPFKRAFDGYFVLVVGTSGTAAESAALLDRARYDAAAWRYRANGLAQIVTDTEFAFSPQEEFGGRNVILYGNADTNAAWSLVFDDDCPVQASRGRISVGRQTWERDDAAAVFVQKRRGDAYSLAAAFADTGARGTRLHGLLLTFVSGVGYPDYAVFTDDVCGQGDGGVLAAGWFDHEWKVQLPQR